MRTDCLQREREQLGLRAAGGSQPWGFQLEEMKGFWGWDSAEARAHPTEWLLSLRVPHIPPTLCPAMFPQAILWDIPLH